MLTLVQQIARIPLLVVLLIVMQEAAHQTVRSAQEAEAALLWPDWPLFVFLGLGFVAVALVGRDARHQPWLLAVEIGAAAILAVVPTLGWAALLDPVTDFVVMHQLGYAQPLAMAWLGIAVHAAVRQRRRARAEPSAGTEDRPA